MKLVVTSADELKTNKEFQTAVVLCWPSIRAHLDDRLREKSGGDPTAAGMYLKAHFDVVGLVEGLIADAAAIPQVRAPKLHNEHFKD